MGRDCRADCRQRLAVSFFSRARLARLLRGLVADLHQQRRARRRDAADPARQRFAGRSELGPAALQALRQDVAQPYVHDAPVT